MKFLAHWYRRISLLALLVIPFFVMEHSYGMVAAEILSEGAAKFGLAGEEAAEEGLARAAAAAERSFGEVGVQELGGASKEVSEAFNASLKEGLEQLGKEIAELKIQGRLTPENIEGAASDIFKNQKTNFVNNATDALSKTKSYNEFDESLLKKAGVQESQFANFGEKLPSAIEAREVTVEIKALPEIEQNASASLIKSDIVQSAEVELSAVERSGSQPDIKVAQENVDVAKKNLVADQQSRATQAQENTTSTEKELKAAQTQDDKIDADTKANEAIKAQEADVRLSYKQELEEAKLDLQNTKATKANAKKELDAAQKAKAPQEEINAKEAAYEEASEKVTKAEENLLEKENQILKKSDLYNNKWQKAKILGARAKRSTFGTFKKLPASIWSKLKFGLEQILISVLFGLPNMIEQAYDSAMARKKLLQTLENYQFIGGIWFKIPDFWINKKDPINSLYVYVGVPSDGFPITDTFLKSANYYVVKTDYNPWGTASITDANASAFVHLNTGFVFVSDGQAEDPDNPTLPFRVKDSKKGEGLINHLNALAGRAAAGVKTEGIEYYVNSYEAGYNGNKAVGLLFALPPTKPGENPENVFPPLLVPTVKALQEGTTFGVDAKGKALYLVQSFKGFNKSEKDNGKTIMAALLGIDSLENAPEGAQDVNYVLENIYIYQADTPIVQLVKKQILANDPDKQKLLNSITDYVVMLDRENNIVPLMTLQPMILPANSKQSAFARYALNPAIAKMKSIIDGSNVAYDAHGGTIDATLPEIDAPKEVSAQIQAMQQYFAKKIKYGPFKYSGTILTIDKSLADQNVFVYKAAGFLEGGFDDYFVALEATKDEKTGQVRLAVSSLPSNGIVFFVSLVTSRFYDNNLHPYAPPIAKLKDYYITKNNTVATGIPEDSTLPQAKAPLYTLYVQGEYNPSPKPANFTGILPVPAFWVLDSTNFVMQNTTPIGDYLQKNQKDLLSKIQDTHNSWIAVLDITDPGALAKKMGPFNFTLGIDPIILRAVNATALRYNYYIYTSNRYPDEYLVLSTDAEGNSSGGEFNLSQLQRYAISLSNGNVYDAQANGNRTKSIILDPLMQKLALTQDGIDKRIADDVTNLNKLQKSLPADKTVKESNKAAQLKTIKALLDATPTQKAVLYDLLNTIENSQTAYKQILINSLYSDNLTFAGRQLYLPKDSYNADQYIYADVTGLGSPIDANGNEIPDVVKQVTDYYVTYEQGAVDPVTGVQTDIFANPLNKNSSKIFSLVSGAGFDRSGSFVTSYQSIKITTQNGQTVFSDLNDFVMKIFAIIKERMRLENRPETIVLENKIQPLLNQEYQAIKDELQNIADAKKDSLAQYATKASLAETLFSESLAYIPQSPASLPRYLKKNVTKYYLVIPPASSALDDDSIKSYENNRTFIDYDIDTTDHNGPNAKGMIYDRNGKPLQLLTGWLLESARAYAGILIDQSGNQTLSIGIEHPSLPVTYTPLGSTTPVSAMIKTPITVPNDTTTSFDFYYNNQIDTYFVQITTQLSKYFIDLSAGYGYNLDGTPRWNEVPVFTNDKNEVLFVGTDSFGLKKVAYKKDGSNKFLIYNQMVGFGDVGTYQTQDVDGNSITRNYLKTGGAISFSDYNNAKGSYITLLSDSFGDQGAAAIAQDGATPTLQELRLGYAYLDATGNVLQNPFYLVWDQVQVENPYFIANDPNNPEGPNNQKYIFKIQFVGKFMPNATLKFSLLNYIQTRVAGNSVSGQYQASDFYNFPRGICDPNDPNCVKTPKVTGIIFVSQQDKQMIQEIFYQNQRCPLTKQSDTTFSSAYSNEQGVMKPITVKLERSQDQNSPLTAYWLSITDGTKILDFAHDPMVWDTLPLPPGIIDITNLDYKKRKVWKLNVSSFVTNQILKANFPGLHNNALATILNAGFNKISFDNLDFTSCDKNSISDSIKKEIGYGLQAISFDPTGQLYLPHVPSKTPENPVMKRFIYTFGINQVEKNLSFYDPALKGWSVDLYNGILYEPAIARYGSYPSGVSLDAGNLAELLGFLRLYVIVNEQGIPMNLGVSNCRAKATTSPLTTGQ